MSKDINGDSIRELLEKAKQSAARAYAPYSDFHVGAALLTEQGNIYTGCNVENASFGLTVCAERNAVFTAVAAEGPGMKIRAVAVVSGIDAPAPPCGACRQVIAEFSGSHATEIFFYTEEGLKRKTTDQLLPDGFKF